MTYSSFQWLFLVPDHSALSQPSIGRSPLFHTDKGSTFLSFLLEVDIDRGNLVESLKNRFSSFILSRLPSSEPMPKICPCGLPLVERLLSTTMESVKCQKWREGLVNLALWWNLSVRYCSAVGKLAPMRLEVGRQKKDMNQAIYPTIRLSVQ